MMADLTHNFIKTKSNLTPSQHVRVLKALKKTGMPARYIRNRKLHEQYKGLDETPSPPPPLPTPVAPEHAKDVDTPFQPGYTPIKNRVKGQKRDYMTDGFLQGYGSPI
jgi:hypothetical protein